TRKSSRSPKSSNIEFEKEDVPIFDDVFLAFGTEQAFFLDRLLAAEGEEVVGRVAVGLDEAFLEVRMDDAGRARGFGATPDSPGANFLHAGCEVGDEIQQAIGGVNESIEAGLSKAHIGEEFVALGRLELRDFRFQGAADADDLAALFR